MPVNTAVDVADAVAEIDECAAACRAEFFVHAVDLDTKRVLSYGGDRPVVAASVIKVPVLATVAELVDRGDLDWTTRLIVTQSDVSPGPTGLSRCQDFPIELSVRDLCSLMLSISDNTATDVLLGHIGLDAVRVAIADLEMWDTQVLGDCGYLHETLARDLGLADVDELETAGGEVPAELLETARCVDPDRTNRTTPRDCTLLLNHLWERREVGPAWATAWALLGQQLWPHRLRSGFADGVVLHAKTGTMPFWRNEIAVIEWSGHAAAVAVFSRAEGAEDTQLQIDLAIGRVARAAFAAVTSDA